jgi:uncharacterized protein DUF3145
MGDVTNGQLTVYQCSPKEALEFLSFISDNYLALDWGSSESTPDDAVMLDRVYGGEASVGMVLNASLSTDAPDSVYMMFTDPKYEFLGSLEIYTPELGVFQAECDAEGNVVLSPGDLIAMIDAAADGGQSIEQLRMTVQKALGQPWFDAIKNMPEQPARVQALDDDEED